MSSNDGNNNEDVFCNMPGSSEMLQQPGGGGGVSMQGTMLWSNHLLGTQYMQTAHPHQQQQNQHYNDYMYNMHAPFTASGQAESYSVLPVGHGNFLKVYHCQENTASGLTSDGGLYHPQPQLQQFQQHQPQPTYHVQQAPPQPTSSQMFNSYELFSSNTLMPTPDTQGNLSHDVSSHTQPQQPSFLFLNNSAVHEDHGVPAGNSTTNMIINKLVNNWSPNLTGGTYMQFGAQVPQMATQTMVSSNTDVENVDEATLPELINNNVIVPQAVQTPPSHMETPINSPILPHHPIKQQQLINHVLPVNQPQLEVPAADVSYTEPVVKVAIAVSPSNAVPLPTNNAVIPEVKKRIVAEVKPMRMTYSDVLSKVNNQQPAPQLLNAKHNMTRGGGAPTVAATQIGNERKFEHRNNLTSESISGSASMRRQVNNEESTVRSMKKSPIHENKDNMQQVGSSSNGKPSKRPTNSNTQHKQPQKPPQKSGTGDTTSKKRINNKRNDVEFQADPGKGPKRPAAEKDFNGYYNVTAKHNDNFERPLKPGAASSNSSTSNVNSRKPSKSSSAYYAHSSNASGSSYGSSNQNRIRYNTANSSSFSYSSKRSNRSNYTTSSMSTAPNPNYELAKKFLRTWLVYTLKILNWLYYLVYDIVVVGCSIGYERLFHAYESGLVYVQQLRRDLKQNSNKPSIWLKNYWRRFDARFKKNSRWAFWRRFYKKKLTETPTESFKNGRLPQTGEEAMYSLLNCKGKDAYSILGVPADSSQEQIRKHYKKIAVLVHPDKNKLPGAEEAFKVLQRAFELIGEPENRNGYDQSLAEALHAEKAWTELHDLLSQLQNKITEAANTIRCSTCCLRHFRKLTDRPHYAARECASCKIRHSAREGDIWAETSFLGLRWKYLALMEGKVYDITEWANCQKGALSHLEPNSHMVQYRIVRGAQQQQHQQQQQQQQQQQEQTHHHHSPHHRQQYQHSHGHGLHHDRGSSSKFKRDVPPSEASLHEFLDNLYSGQNPNQPTPSAYSSTSRRRARRN